MKDLDTAERYIRASDAAREMAKAGLTVPNSLGLALNQLGAELDRQSRQPQQRPA